MIEEELTIPLKGADISGTVCLPESGGIFPTVLMIHGSGPLDRDHNMKKQKLNDFNTFAHYLAQHGIASYRYDKRGCGKSTGDFYQTGHFDLVDDAKEIVESLKQQDFCDTEHIYLLGHSEGAVIAPQIGVGNSSVAGLILLCPVGRSLEEVSAKQRVKLEHDINGLTGIKGNMTKLLFRVLGGSQKEQNRQIEKIKTSIKKVIRIRFKKIPALWHREILSLDVEGVFKQVRRPMLVIGGEKDLQCSPDDVGRIVELASVDVEAHVIPGMTHILRLDPEEPSFLNYKKIMGNDIEGRVLKLISLWVQRQVSVLKEQA